MAKYRAVIVGAGRMGSGWGLNERSHYYVHAKTYGDLKSRVELAAFVDPSAERREFAFKKWGVPSYSKLDEALTAEKPDIVSICTQPEYRKEIIQKCYDADVKGIWCEKPYDLKMAVRIPVQVNYCRRFDRFHQQVKYFLKDATQSRLVIMAKKDVHTVCHLTDLARWWGVKHFNYVDTPDEPGAYFLRYQLKDRVWQEMAFTHGGISGDEFMKTALTNLVDFIDGKANELLSPPENAILSEEWADKILEGK